MAGADDAVLLIAGRVGDGDPEEVLEALLLFGLPFLEGLRVIVPATYEALSLDLGELACIGQIDRFEAAL